jgi:sulfur relay (sulfurtransferase) DsrC/TusE family protein
MKIFFHVVIFTSVICYILSNTNFDTQEIEENDKVYVYQSKSQCYSALRYLQTTDTETNSDTNSQSSSTDTGSSDSQNTSSNSQPTNQNPSSTTTPTVPTTTSTPASSSSTTDTNHNPLSSTSSTDSTDDAEPTLASAASEGDDSDYNTSSNVTSIYDTNPHLAKKLASMPRKLFSGNFWDTIQNLRRNYTEIGSIATIKMSISLIRNGVARPDSDILGDYYTADGVPVRSEIPFNEVENYTDILGVPWHQKYQIDEKGFKYADSYADSLTKLYTRLHLLTGNPNETDFISMERNVSIAYSKRVMQSMFPQFNGTNVETAPFTFEDLANFSYNPRTSGKILAILQREYSAKLFGFSMDTCPKYKSFQKKAMNEKALLDEYNEAFDVYIKRLVNKFANRIRYSPMGTNDTYLQMTEQQLRSNTTLIHILAEVLRADFTYFDGDDLAMAELKKDLILTDDDYNFIKNIRKFAGYEIKLYSHLHTFLIVGPFYDFMFSEFNKMISSQGAYTRKLINFTVTDYVIAAIYKLFHYDKSYYRPYWNLTATKKFLYKKLPLITFGYNIQFELWEEKQSKTKSNYYIMFRENLAQEPLFILRAEDFIWAMKLFYMDPNFDTEERIFWCGA